MAPIEKGRKLTDNPKNRRLEMRLTLYDAEQLQRAAIQFKMNKSAILMQGLRLVELQMKSPAFHDLSDCLLIRVIEKNGELTEEDKRVIKEYAKDLINELER